MYLYLWLVSPAPVKVWAAHFFYKLFLSLSPEISKYSKNMLSIELKNRRDKIRHLMLQKEIDALLIATNVNMIYANGSAAIFISP